MGKDRTAKTEEKVDRRKTRGCGREGCEVGEDHGRQEEKGCARGAEQGWGSMTWPKLRGKLTGEERGEGCEAAEGCGGQEKGHKGESRIRGRWPKLTRKLTG